MNKLYKDGQTHGQVIPVDMANRAPCKLRHHLGVVQHGAG